MKKDLNRILLPFIIVSLTTVFIAGVKTTEERSQVLGTTTTSYTRQLDNGNGTLYIEYTNTQDLYSLVADWQGKYPGRTIMTTTQLNTGQNKFFAVLFTYIGK